MSAYDSVDLKILWDRLVAIADEIVLSLVRTSFSINVREGYDLSCILFDARGRMLAQGSYSVPSFTGTAPQTLAHMLRRFPPETLAPGDVVVTNDPWMGTGHLFDVNVMRPVFRGDVLIGFTMSVTHLPDIGGVGMSSTATEIYHEGLRLPVMKLARAGELDRGLIELVEMNVRTPEETVGDLMANVSCNEVGGRALLELMDEYGVDDLEPLSDAINDAAAAAMRGSIAEIPDGEYASAIDIEGIDAPIRLQAAVRVAGDAIAIDFAGTDGPVRGSINVPMCYTRAQSYYVVKCLTIPSLPNNEGAVRRIDVHAPDGCILNVHPPWPTGARHSVGHFVVPLLMSAFAEALPDRVQADGSMMDVFSVQARDARGRSVSSLFFLSGGLGAMRGLDGRDTTPGPSNMTVVPTEVWENLTGIVIERRALLPDSGGPGEWRGGAGQEVVFRNDTSDLVDVALMGQRTRFAARGYLGGRDGRLREYLRDAATVEPKGRHLLAPGDRIVMREAGGGGFGDPHRRDPARVLADVCAGRVSVEAARRDYGVEIDLTTGTARRSP